MTHVTVRPAHTLASLTHSRHWRVCVSPLTGNGIRNLSLAYTETKWQRHCYFCWCTIVNNREDHSLFYTPVINIAMLRWITWFPHQFPSRRSDFKCLSFALFQVGRWDHLNFSSFDCYYNVFHIMQILFVSILNSRRWPRFSFLWGFICDVVVVYFMPQQSFSLKGIEKKKKKHRMICSECKEALSLGWDAATVWDLSLRQDELYLSLHFTMFSFF